MRLWCEVWESATSMLGVVNLAQASISRKLDAAGQVRIVPSPGDFNADWLLAAGRYVHVYRLDATDDPELVEVGYLQKRSWNARAGGRSLEWTATDGLVDLQRYTTGRGRVYSNQSLREVVIDLAQLAGMGVAFDAGVDGLETTQRFDGMSALAALIRLTEIYGLHLRTGAKANEMTFGALGEELEVWITNILTGTRDREVDRYTAYIEGMNVVDDGMKIINWIEPVSGPADGALTLRFATRTGPYPIKTGGGPQGQTIYYLEDTASQNLYGTWQETESPDDLLVPLTDVYSAVNAANVLYDWAATFLRRNAWPRKTYKVTAVKIEQAIRPGDKVYVDYDGEVFQVQGASGERRPVREERIDDYLWVVSVTERHNLGGKEVDLELATVDEAPEDAAEIMARTIAARKRDKVAVKLTIPQQTTNDTVSLTAGAGQDVLFEVSAEAVLVTACFVTLTRETASGPGLVKLALNGERVEGELLLKTGQLEATTNIGDLLVTQTAKGAIPLRGEHTLTVEALTGVPNDLEVKVQLYEVVAGLEEAH